MAPRVRPKLVPLVLAATIALGTVGARADPTPDERRRAAAAFDEAVGRFNRAEFAEAARGFLAADQLAPSPVAITNAIAAGRRAGDHLLVARASERAIARGDALVEARAALAEAATRLARLEIACDTAPCTLRVDGEPAPAGGLWVLPGTLRVEAQGPAGAVAEERVVCIAGATYKIALHPAAPRPPDTPPPRRGLPRAVFFTGAAVTAVLAGVTVWSGVDAIAAKRALPLPEAPQGDLDDVRAKARRTDFLLLGAGLAGIATAVVGVFTDWRGEASSPTGAAVVPVPGGVAFGFGGHFR